MKRVKEINVIWMQCIFYEAPVMEGLESRLIGGAVSEGSRDKAVVPLLIRGAGGGRMAPETGPG